VDVTSYGISLSGTRDLTGATPGANHLVGAVP
jgi:hypothetical protein